MKITCSPFKDLLFHLCVEVLSVFNEGKNSRANYNNNPWRGTKNCLMSKKHEPSEENRLSFITSINEWKAYDKI